MEERYPTTAAVAATKSVTPEKRHRSIFDVPPSFFDSCILLPSPHSYSSTFDSSGNDSSTENLAELENDAKDSRNGVVSPRWTCNTCKDEFDSLQDQRSHFKSDIHRFNVKLSIAGKNIVKEEDFDELTSDSFRDFDVSSISGSEDEEDKGTGSRNDVHKGSSECVKRKLFIRLHTGEMVSVWKSLVVNESENILYEDEKTSLKGSGGFDSCLRENEVIGRLKGLIHEPRDKTHLRIVLLASGGHFAGCVFDGNLVVAHKTFHRYVVRAKAGKKQSTKDAGGKGISSAGASLRRYNELALKKEIQELLTAWKPYFDASSCVFIYAPSSNRQLFFSGEKPYFSNQHSAVRNVPLTIRRPTLKEARRIYEQLVHVVYEVDDKEIANRIKHDFPSSEIGTQDAENEEFVKNSEKEACLHDEESDEHPRSSDSESEVTCTSTPLHEEVKSGDVEKVLELLEQGLDPCIKDERGRTPYMLASNKEVRNTFRRFMALNLDKWDWNAAKVPSALTRELEDAQAAKQAEKNAKKKAKAKEMKKLRKEKDKKAQAQAQAQTQAISSSSSSSSSFLKAQVQPQGKSQISKEEETKRAQIAEREKRAAAAEKRIAAAAAAQSSPIREPSASLQPKGSGIGGDSYCSCCYSSLAGKVPFHRYNYKYCSTTCMHLHRTVLEDG